MKEIKDNYVLKKDYEELLEKLCDLEQIVEMVVPLQKNSNLGELEVKDQNNNEERR